MENLEKNKNSNDEFNITGINKISGKIESMKLTEIKEEVYIIRINQISGQATEDEKISNSICKIKIESQSETIFGYGFLLKFYIGQEVFFCLISNENIIKKDIIDNSNIIISLYFNNELKTNNLKEGEKKRYMKSFIDIGIDVTAIEILEKDNISKDYFLYDELQTDNNYIINSQIYIPQFELGKKLENAEGTITKINKYAFNYISNTKYDISGYPIFLVNSIDVLGINKGNNENKEEKNGFFIYSLIDLIKNDIFKLRNNGKFVDGKYTYEDGKYYIGEFKDNIPNGKGKKYYKNGNIQYEGDFINGQFEGNGKYYYENGEYFIGKYKNGLRNGKGIKYYKNGNILFEGEYINGKVDGYGKWIWEDGEYFIGQFKNGIINGKGKEYYSNGQIKYEGEYVNNKFEGKGKYFWKNGEYYIGQEKNGLINGKGTLYYSNGKVKYEGDWINDKFDGNGKYIFENDQYYIGQWKDNLRNGKGIMYYSNGNIFYEGDWINDKRDGKGKCIMNGGDYYIGQWKNGGANGKGVIYHKNGKIKYKGDFVNGKKYGIGHFIYGDDTYYIGNWKNDLRDGWGTIYDSNGKIMKEGKWNNGAFFEN